MEKGIFNNFYQYLVNHSDEELQAVRNAEPAWLSEKRETAFQVFQRMGFPSRKNEDWRFTNLERFLNDTFKFHPREVEAKRPVDIDGLDACRIVMMNGKYAPQFSDPLPEGMTFLDTEAALRDPRFADKFGSVASEENNPMLALNTAFFRDCSVLHIAAKAVIEKPVHISHLFTDHPEAGFIPYRSLVIAEKLSESTLIESFHSESHHPLFVNFVSEQIVEESAVFHSHIINDLGETVYFVHHREVFQYRNSTLNNSNITLGSAPLVRHDLNFRLKETGTETNLLGAYVLSGQQHVDNHTLMDHQSPNCNSSELYKGILDDRSRAVFNGKVFVRPDAQKTNAFQQNNNLLLSNQATVNSKPQLEIFADDVKCSHGSTVGQQNKEALFYLKSRGIGDEVAGRMLMEAFVFDVLSRLDVPSVRAYTLHLLNKKLGADNLVIA